MIRIILATLTAGAVAVGLCAQIGPAAAQDYPNRPITMIAPEPSIVPALAMLSKS